MEQLTDQEMAWAELVCAVVRGEVPGEVPVALRAEWAGRPVVVLAAVTEDPNAAVAVQPLAILTDRESAMALRPAMATAGADV